MARAGDVIGRYVLEQELGKGAAGAVFLAHDTLLDVRVCIKLLHEALATDAAILARFKRELLLARRVAHPGVCRVFDLGEEGETRFLVMEYVPGEDLAKLLNRERRLEVPRAISLLRQVCQALGAAHKEGVVHRDLKPGNIILREDGRATLVDFGIATATDLDRLTRPGIVMGSRSYMAPEVWQGAAATPATDVWAAGVILYGCVTGRLPYKGEGITGVLEAIQRTTPTPPSVHNPAVPPSLEAVIQQAMSVDPKTRYPDGLAMDFALAELEGAPVRALSSSGPSSSAPSSSAPSSSAPSSLRSEPSGQPAVDGTQERSSPFAPRTDDVTLYPGDRSPGARGEEPPDLSPGTPITGELSIRAPSRAPEPDEAQAERTHVDVTPSPWGVPPRQLDTPPGAEPVSLPGPDEPTKRVAWSDLDGAPEAGERADGDRADEDDLERAFLELPTRQTASLDATRTERLADRGADRRRDRGARPWVRYAAAGLGGVALFAIGGLLALSRGGEDAATSASESAPREPAPVEVPKAVPEAGEAEARRADAAPETPSEPPVEPPPIEPPPDAQPPPAAPPNETPPDDATEDAPGDVWELGLEEPERPAPVAQEPSAQEPPAKEPRARASRATAERGRYLSRRRALDGAVRGQGLLWGDVPRLDAQRRKMFAAAKAGRYGEAAEAAQASKALVEGTAIDRRFVEKKLARFNQQYDKSKDPGLKKELSKVFLDVTKALSREDHRGANAALNRGFKLLGQPG